MKLIEGKTRREEGKFNDWKLNEERKNLIKGME